LIEKGKTDTTSQERGKDKTDTPAPVGDSTRKGKGTD